MARIAILYNEPTLHADHPDALSEHEVVYTVGAVEGVLSEAGYEVIRVGADIDPGSMIAQLKELKPDAVFNLFEGLPQMGLTEAYAAGILEWLGIPYTGCPAASIVLARNKPLTKRLLRDAKVPTPKFELIHELPAPSCKLGWPVIVKPSNQDASVGIDQTSVVANEADYIRQVEHVLKEYGAPVLVEEFILGREMSLMMFEKPELTPLVYWEMKFIDPDPNYWQIITYDSKWKVGSRDFEMTPMDYDPKMTKRLRSKMARIGTTVFQMLGCRDMARVDYRVTPDDKPYVLEVNPNPDFSPLAGLCDGLDAAGVTHAQLTVQLVENALARGAQRITKPEGIEVIQW